MTSRDLPLNL